jgi:signal transduction histidine kinase
MTVRKSRALPVPLLGGSKALVGLAVALALAVVLLVWLGFRATGAWLDSVQQLVERRVNEKVALLAAALDHDMKGAQTRVLVPLNQEHFGPDMAYELSDTFARAFARFPYPESFFAWRNTSAGSDTTSGDGDTFVFNRADRPPAWAQAPAASPRYPVVILQGAATDALHDILARVRQEGASRTRFVMFDTRIAGSRYQVVAHLLYRGDNRNLFGVVGFTVNLDWVRRYYFDELTRQVSLIGGRGDDLTIAIVDDAGQVVASTARPGDGVGQTRRFPLLFCDPVLLRHLARQTDVPYWSARVTAPKGAALGLFARSGSGGGAGTAAGANRLIAVLSLAAFATLIALLLTARAVRVNAQLASMKSEFVSTVTHELKTPLSLIRLVADTLGQGRYKSPATVAEYAGLLAKESARLGLLIDNLLTYSRIMDVGDFYSFESVDVSELIDNALERCRWRLTELGFDLTVDVPAELPALRADRAALLHVLVNVIDNALKYSGDARVLTVRACRQEKHVRIDVADRGPGIAPEQRAHSFDRFHRGGQVSEGGTGLGLTIADRIMRGHRGSIAIRGREDGGTIVSLLLPISQK